MHKITAAQFGLGTYSAPGQKAFPGIVVSDDQVVPVKSLMECAGAKVPTLMEAASVLGLLDHWEHNLPLLQAAVDLLSQSLEDTAGHHLTSDIRVPMASLRVHPPVNSRQIFLSGANYFKHVVDMIVDWGPGKTPGTEDMDASSLRTYAEDLMNRRRHSGVPYMFTKPVSVLSGAFDPIIVPPDAKEPDWEVELAVVIGRQAQSVKRADALSYVAGYMVVNDITDRGQIWVKGDMKAMGTDWLTSKCRPTYLPCGPYFVPAAFVPDPNNLKLELRLNGKVMQSDSTADMIFDVQRLIEHISHMLVLQPGDIICTGSPAGNGTHYNRFLQNGDLVSATITGLGEQRTPVIDQRTVQQ